MPHVGNFPGPGYPKPLAIHPTAFESYDDTQDWVKNYNELRNNIVALPQNYYAPVFLPHKATIRKVTLYGRRMGAADNITLYLYRDNRAGTQQELCVLVTNWTLGFSSISTEEISNPVIDNEGYDYCALVTLDPDVEPTQCTLTGVKIDWT